MCSSPAAVELRRAARLAGAGVGLCLLASGCSAVASGEGSAVAGAPTGQAPAGAAPGGAVAPGSGGANLLKNSDFEEGVALPWTTSFSEPASGKGAVVAGALCLEVARKGENPWDAQVRHREMVLQQGHTYTVEFVARASRPTKVRPKVGMSGPPYAEYWASTIDVGPEPRRFVGRFTMGAKDDPTAELAFHAGGALAAADGTRLCIDEVRLADPQFTAPPRQQLAPVPKVRVNQLGYAPALPKGATVRN
jgi:endoglucanase